MCIELGIVFAVVFIGFASIGEVWTAFLFFCISVWCFYCACDEKTKKKNSKNKNNSCATHHEMSDDDKWLEENSWVWSDPNYNGKRNRKK